MKDFQLRNDTKLLFRNDPAADLAAISAGKKTLFVYGGGSAKKNGCYEDVKNAVEAREALFTNWWMLRGNWRQLKRGFSLSRKMVLSL